jgi:aryl-alcohol dehydrogenase-like predicted oxidoreductase
MGAVRETGLAGALGVAPGPANGFTLDLIDCIERFSEVIDWAMIILSPMEPWPGELVLDAAAAHGVSIITRVVDYGGIFHDDVRPGHDFPEHDHRSFRPAGWIEEGRRRLELMRPYGERHGLTPLQLSCQWNLAHPPVACVAPTLIQERGPGARAIEAKRDELGGLPCQILLNEREVAEIRTIGDNRGCMALKGASTEHQGEPLPDRWPLSGRLAELATRWEIAPERDLVRSP